MDSELQRRYFQLRSQLSGLNYSCNFGLDALDVVQELFTDLVSTTESYTLLQEKEHKLSHDLAIAQTHLLPLRKEIGRLTKENHHFHLDNIRIKEESVEEISKLIAENQKAHLEVTELRHVVYLKDIEIQKAETERSRLREAYEGLAAASLTGSATKIKRSIKSTTLLAPNGEVRNGGNKENLMFTVQSLADSSDATTSAAADKKLMEQMRSQIESLTKSLKIAQERNETLDAAVRRREQELGRELQKVTSLTIEGGDGTSSKQGRLEMLLMADTANSRIIDQLNGQVDFLNEQLAVREAQLGDLSEKLLTAQEIRIECDNRGKLLDASREENALLVAELRELEERIEELNRYTDPEGGVSIQSLGTHSTSQHSSPESSNGINGKAKQQQITDTPASKFGSPSSAIEKLREERAGLLGEVGNLHGKVSQMASEENMLRTRLMRTEERMEELKKELQRVKTELEGMGDLLSSRTQEATEAKSELNDLKGAMAMLQETAKEKTERLAAFEGTNRGSANVVSRLEQEKKFLMESLDSTNSELSTVRKEKFQLSLQYEELVNGELRTLRSDCDSLSQTVEHLTEELTNLRGQDLALEAECRGYRDDLEAERSRSRQLQRHCDELDMKYAQTSSELTSAMSNIVQLQGMVRMLQSQEEDDREGYIDPRASIAGASIGPRGSEVVKSPGGESVVSGLSISASVRGKSAEMQSLRKQLLEERTLSERLSNELSKLQREMMTTKQQFVVASARQQASEAEHKNAVQLLESRDHQLSQCQSELASMKSEMLRLSNELKSREAFCEALSMSDEERLRKIETLSAELDRITSDNRLLIRRVEEASRTIKENEHKVSEAGAVASSAISRVSVSERAAEAAQSSQRELQREIGTLRGRIFDLEQRLEETTKAADKNRADAQALLSEKNEFQTKYLELKSVITSIDSSSRESSHRLTRMAGQLDESKQALKRSEEESNRLREDIRERDLKIASLMENLSALDAERDRLQNQLDILAEESMVTDEGKEKARRESEDLRHRLHECEQRLTQSIEEITVSRRHCAVAEGRIASLKSEIEENNRRFNMASSEISGAAEDLRLMTKENQALTSELAEVTFERDRLIERVGELSAVASNLEQARRGVEIERGDLLLAYRNVLQQKRRLETDLATMSTMKQRMSVSLQQMHSDQAELRSQLSEKANSMDREAYDRAALVTQIETLNSQLVSSAQSIEAVEADNRRMIQENYTLTQANKMLHERITMLLKRATSASDANKVLSTRLASVERERDTMRALAGIEKQKASDLASVVELARAQTATATAQANRYRQALVTTSDERVERSIGAEHSSEKVTNINSSEVPSATRQIRNLTTTTSVKVTSSTSSETRQFQSSIAMGSGSLVAPSASESKDELLDQVLGYDDDDNEEDEEGRLSTNDSDKDVSGEDA